MMESNYIKVGAAQGWQCPICHRVLSPWTQECPCKGKGEWSKVNTDGYYTITMSEYMQKLNNAKKEDNDERSE